MLKTLIILEMKIKFFSKFTIKNGVKIKLCFFKDIILFKQILNI